MSSKPKTLDELWSEKDLCDKLALPIRPRGRSVQLSYWIRGGLKFAEKAGRRYFFEQDVIDYLWGRRNAGADTEADG